MRKELDTKNYTIPRTEGIPWLHKTLLLLSIVGFVLAVWIIPQIIENKRGVPKEAVLDAAKKELSKIELPDGWEVVKIDYRMTDKKPHKGRILKSYAFEYKIEVELMAKKDTVSVCLEPEDKENPTEKGTYRHIVSLLEFRKVENTWIYKSIWDGTWAWKRVFGSSGVVCGGVGGDFKGFVIGGSSAGFGSAGGFAN